MWQFSTFQHNMGLLLPGAAFVVAPYSQLVGQTVMFGKDRDAYSNAPVQEKNE
jgi:hypothetical protein